LVETPDASPLERFCVLLADAGVEFMVIGGQAEALMGSPRVTYDVDLCYRRTADNLERLARVLRALKLTLRGAPPDLRFRLDAKALALGSSFTFEVDGEYPLDLRACLEPIGTYDDVLAGSETLQIGGRTVPVIGLEDLIRIKRHLARPKDRESLLQLEAIKRLRQEEGLR
jgi:predicted nucleotidyltransferase